MVGYVTRFGHPRLSDDVQIDKMYVAEPLLPDTRSELTLPLRTGPKIIGALDIQSIQPSAFTQDDLIALQTLADQLATAIENMRLVTQVQTALSETSQIIQNQTLENWERLFAKQGILAYEYDLLEVRQVTEPDSVLVKSEPENYPDLESTNQPQRGCLRVPIKLRDQVIGTIIMENQDPDHIWSQDELTIVEATANQAALTVENARLWKRASAGRTRAAYFRVNW
jgi:GAF domain-containing protein